MSVYSPHARDHQSRTALDSTGPDGPNRADVFVGRPIQTRRFNPIVSRNVTPRQKGFCSSQTKSSGAPLARGGVQ